MEAYWPGPMTLILPKNPALPDAVTAGLDTVGIRMPSNETARALIRASGRPLAAPSANTSGKPSPTTARHVYDAMNGKIPSILDGMGLVVLSTPKGVMSGVQAKKEKLGGEIICTVA